MTKVNNINSNNKFKKPLLNPKNTGYIAGAAMLIATTRAFTKSKPIAKSHKIFGAIAAALTLLHIGVVEYLHYKYKKM